MSRAEVTTRVRVPVGTFRNLKWVAENMKARALMYRGLVPFLIHEVDEGFDGGEVDPFEETILVSITVEMP